MFRFVSFDHTLGTNIWLLTIEAFLGAFIDDDDQCSFDHTLGTNILFLTIEAFLGAFLDDDDQCLFDPALGTTNVWFDQPELGIVDFHGSKANNIVLVRTSSL